jgi:hypothetical protein
LPVFKTHRPEEGLQVWVNLHGGHLLLTLDGGMILDISICLYLRCKLFPILPVFKTHRPEEGLQVWVNLHGGHLLLGLRGLILFFAGSIDSKKSLLLPEYPLIPNRFNISLSSVFVLELDIYLLSDKLEVLSVLRIVNIASYMNLLIDCKNETYVIYVNMYELDILP